MANQQLIDYIKQQLGQRNSKEEIIKSLTGVGWQTTDIEEGFRTIEGTLATQPSPVSNNATSVSSNTFLGPLELLEAAFKIFKERFWQLAGISLVPFLMMAVLAVIGLVFLGPGLFGYIFSKISPSLGSVSPPPTGMIISFFAYVVIAGLVMLVFQTWKQLAFLAEVCSENKIGVKEAYERSKKKILSYWWISFLLFWIVGGGFFFFLIPGIIFQVWFSLTTFVFMVEGLKGMSALLKSREYVRGHWWGVAGRTFIISFVPTILVSILAFFVESFFKVADLGLAGEILKIIYHLTVNLGTTLLLPIITTIFFYLMYRNLRQIRGEFEFNPSKKSKVIYLLMGILGFLIFPILFISIILLTAIDPNAQMAKARDARRRSDQGIVLGAIERYHAQKGAYPLSLEELVTAEELGKVPTDPKTGLLYEYQPEGDTYRLCINYESKSEGRRCFPQIMKATPTLIISPTDFSEEPSPLPSGQL